jgi:hypothetical protein
MERIKPAWVCLCASLACILLAACGGHSHASKEAAPEPSASADAAPTASDANAPASASRSVEIRQTVAEAEKLAVVGSYDEAAARLLKLRMSGAQFSEKDAAAYRDALQAAYSRALEAAGKGDPRGKAAVEMIRAARAR